MPKLILKFEAAVIKEFPFTASTLTVGRKPDNDIAIDHPAVSGHHCRILLQGDTYFVEDLNSTNGTLVNDKKIIKAGIHDKDVIAIAKHTLVFVNDRPSASQQRGETSPPGGQKAEATAPAPATPAAPPAQPAKAPAKPANPSETIQDVQLAGVPKNKFDRIGGLTIVEGSVDAQTDFILKDTSTYLGKSDRANIKIKAGMMAPDLGAMVNRKSDGYVIVAIKEGYPKVNGIDVEKERRLNEGDVIEVGDTKLQFYLKAP